MKYLLQNFIAVFCLSFIFTNAYAVIPKYDNPEKTIIVTEKSPFFEIEQAANPTTGYSWKVKQYDSRLLKLDNSHYLPPLSQIAGAGGKMIWAFQVNPEAFQQTHPAETNIELVYARSWNLGENPKNVMFKVVFQR